MATRPHQRRDVRGEEVSRKLAHRFADALIVFEKLSNEGKAPAQIAQEMGIPRLRVRQLSDAIRWRAIKAEIEAFEQKAALWIDDNFSVAANANQWLAEPENLENADPERIKIISDAATVANTRVLQLVALAAKFGRGLPNLGQGGQAVLAEGGGVATVEPESEWD